MGVARARHPLTQRHATVCAAHIECAGPAGSFRLPRSQGGGRSCSRLPFQRESGQGWPSRRVCSEQRQCENCGRGPEASQKKAGCTITSPTPMAMSSAAKRVAVRAHRTLASSSVPRRAIHASSAPLADQRQHSDRSAWHNVSAGPADHYRILNIPHHATKAEIKRAYLDMGETRASRRCLEAEHCGRSHST